ncbi:MAG: glycosyltransferase, partial [Balneolales bacterium]|nr:glycosyltransferase [Balneolales bacterium]
VVAFNAEGIRTIVKHGYNGWLAAFDGVPEDNLAEMVMSVYNKPNQQIKENAANDVRTTYSMAANQKKLEEVYLRLL